MSDSQDQAEEAPIDFDSLVLDRHPFNTSGGYGDIYKAPHPQWGFLALKRPRGTGEPGSPSYRVRTFTPSKHSLGFGMRL